MNVSILYDDIHDEGVFAVGSKPLGRIFTIADRSDAYEFCDWVNALAEDWRADDLHTTLFHRWQAESSIETRQAFPCRKCGCEDKRTQWIPESGHMPTHAIVVCADCGCDGFDEVQLCCECGEEVTDDNRAEHVYTESEK